MMPWALPSVMPSLAATSRSRAAGLVRDAQQYPDVAGQETPARQSITPL